MTLEELWDFEDKHPVVFASPRALADARLIAELNRVKGGRRRGRSNRSVLRAARKLATT